MLSLMEDIPLYGGDAGRGVSSSTEPSLPSAEEEPGDRSEIERVLDQLELAEIIEQKYHLAEQISPLIESEKARLVRRLWHRNLGELPSQGEMVEMIIDRFASKAAYNVNKPNVPRENLRHLSAWLTREQQSAERDGRRNMSIKKKIYDIIEGYLRLGCWIRDPRSRLDQDPIERGQSLETTGWESKRTLRVFLSSSRPRSSIKRDNYDLEVDPGQVFGSIMT
ncbi:hypothetical protein HAX54_030659 [Datura stramonium]|uniref:Uncharacterized protein n=1 Tax=Datura stramonium TaxID=4076 RepID=A0ABS8VAX4_DATST|nr:hypothetical protein [Datura stramonium]